MRRQARISAGGSHVLRMRTASALQVWLWLLIFIFQNEFRISRSIQPGQHYVSLHAFPLEEDRREANLQNSSLKPLKQKSITKYLDFDNLPETNFTCAGKVIGGYYADLETSCQMFHVCTVGQQEEPMDIKFLCLNGTVFDQETRVCERVDEVDCTKSEKFYSLNLELYGSTLPPPVHVDVPKTESTEQSKKKTKPNLEESDPSIDETPTTTHSKTHELSTDLIDSTEDPLQDIKKDDYKKTQEQSSTHHFIADQEEDEEYQDEEDGDNVEYEEDYSHSPTTTIQASSSTSTTTTTTTTTRRPPSTTTVLSSTSLHHLSPIPQLISSPLPTITSVSSSAISTSAPSAPSVDPALLSPQEFIYRHRGPGSEAISFQSFRPADGVYITHAPPQQFDHFQYESSRTAPRPPHPRPAPFVQRPQPQPFRPTTLDPRDQLLRPGPTSQSSERHETSIKHRPQTFPSALPAQRPLPFNPYYYERKRSDDSSPEIESTLAARSVAPVTVTERPPTKPKSPPRVIVTASASVSDSNGKRLNYTVGNVVSAVKPIVPINYDDYKESDLIFDPFFLDVPKLQKRRKTRSNVRNRRIFTIPATATVANVALEKVVKTTFGPETSRATTTGKLIDSSTTSTTTVSWNPNDYVDDNYEPHAYVPPGPPPAVVAAYNINKFKKQERVVNTRIGDDKHPRELKLIAGRIEQSKPTVSAPQTTSSQIEGGSTAPAAATPPPPPLEALACATSRSTDCRTRA